MAEALAEAIRHFLRGAGDVILEPAGLEPTPALSIRLPSDGEGGSRGRLESAPSPPATKFVQETRKSPAAHRRFALRGVRAGKSSHRPRLG
ncbi:MAG: hypothetical protein M2R45_03384 [Verrucomicrobia subdivision 3 bacterium]|nr:hypothetical protein [Limisphaerales bacterium]MCS1416703.1 hypothetical protein [Limisphaerales bacterium]